MINIVIADDHQIMLDGLSKMLQEHEKIELVKACNNGVEVLGILPHTSIDILILDLDMPMMNGLECATEVAAKYPEIKIVILTMHAEAALIRKFMEMGVKGYFLKTITQKELIHAIETIDQGGEYFPSDVTKSLALKLEKTIDAGQDHKIATLTSRESSILKLIAQGFTNKEIGEQLHISAKTVDVHRTNMMKKIEVNNVAGVVRFAFQNGLVE